MMTLRAASNGEISIINNIKIRFQRLEKSVDDALDCYTFIARPYNEENFIVAYKEFQDRMYNFLMGIKYRLKRVEELFLCHDKNTGNRFFYSSIIQEWQSCENECNAVKEKLQNFSDQLNPSLPENQQQYLNEILNSIVAEFSSDTQLNSNDLRVKIKNALLEFTLREIQKVYFESQTIKRSCFICYSWGNAANVFLIHKIARDLKKSGLDVKLDVWEKHSGSTQVFAEHITTVDNVIVMGTPDLVEKRNNFSSNGFSRGKMADNYKGNLVAQELELICVRLNKKSSNGHGIINVLISGEGDNSCPAQLRALSFSDTDFRSKTHYSAMFLNLLSKLTLQDYADEKKALHDQYSHIDSQGYEYLHTVYQAIYTSEPQSELDADILHRLSNSNSLRKAIPPSGLKPSRTFRSSARILNKEVDDEANTIITPSVAYVVAETKADTCAISLNDILRNIRKTKKEDQIPVLKLAINIFLDKFKNNNDEFILSHDQHELFPYFEKLLQFILECSDYSIEIVAEQKNVNDMKPRVVYLYLVGHEVKYVIRGENSFIENDLQSTDFFERQLFDEIKTVLLNLDKSEKLTAECEEIILSILLARGHVNFEADILFVAALHKGAIIHSNISGYENLKKAFKYELRCNRMLNVLRAILPSSFFQEKIACLETLSRLYHKRQENGDAQKNIACCEEALALRREYQLNPIPSLNCLALAYTCSGKIQKAIECHKIISEITDMEHEETRGYTCVSVLTPDSNDAVIINDLTHLVVQRKDGCIYVYWLETNKTVISKSLPESEADDIVALLSTPLIDSGSFLLIKKIISRYGCDSANKKNQYTSLLTLGVNLFLKNPRTKDAVIQGLEYFESGLKILKPELANSNVQVEDIDLNGIVVLMFLCNIGIGYYWLHDFYKAERYLSKALQKQQELPEHDGIGLCLHYYGVCLIMGSMNIEHGAQYLKQGFDIFIKCFKAAPQHLFIHLALENCNHIKSILGRVTPTETTILLGIIQHFEGVFDRKNVVSEPLPLNISDESSAPKDVVGNSLTLQAPAALYYQPAKGSSFRGENPGSPRSSY